MYPIKLYFKRLPNLITVISSLTLNLFIWGWLLFYFRPQPDQIFLHYSVLFGVDFIGNWYNVLAVPLSGLFVLVLNLSLGWFLFQKDYFAGYLLNTAGLLTQAVLVVVSILLVFLNV